MLIRDSATLADFCDSLKGVPYIAVDTEFLREKTYYPLLCLVQVAHGPRVAAIDTLVDGLDLRPLGQLLTDPNIVKVFHAAPQDLEIFLQETGAIPSPLFDTQLAAGVCGHGEQPGYSKLVGSLLGVEIDKTSQTTDWSRRPLTDRQLKYAISDVTYLCEVYELLLDELDRTGRAEWIAEELRGLGDETRYRTEPSNAYKRVRVRRPTRRTLGVLRELAAWRETTAQQRDLPRKWVIKDEVLVELAQQLPKTVDDLARIRGMGGGAARGKDGAAILAGIRSALAQPDSDWPVLPKPRPKTNGNESLVALLQALLRLRCEAHGVALRLVATKAHLEVLAAAVDEEPDVPPLRGWRRVLFGNDALALRDGRLALTGLGGDVVAIQLGEAQEPVE